MVIYVDADRLIVDCEALKNTLERCQRLKPRSGDTSTERKSQISNCHARSKTELIERFGPYCRVVLGGIKGIHGLRDTFPREQILLVTQEEQIFAAAVGCSGGCSSGCIDLPCICRCLNPDEDEALHPLDPKCPSKKACKPLRTLYKSRTDLGNEFVQFVFSKGDTEASSSVKLLVSPSEEWLRNLSKVIEGDHSCLKTAAGNLPKTWDEMPWDIVASTLKVAPKLPFPEKDSYEPKVQPLKHNPGGYFEETLWRQWLRLEEPVVYHGRVVGGAGRGAKLMGCPTANISLNEPVSTTPLPLPGCYLGFVCLKGLPVEEKDVDCVSSVLSAGFNPYFGNDQLTVEAHLLKEFKDDFYGAEITLVIFGFLRPESSFGSFQHLIRAIQFDCNVARTILEHESLYSPDMAKYREILKAVSDTPV